MSLVSKFLREKFKKGKGDTPYWEYYNRTRFVANRIKALGLENGAVLDVGGNKKHNTLKEFGIKNIVSLNVQNDADVVASGHELPFSDRVFGCVTCIDTLEHIPRQFRRKVVGELVRVADIAVFIVAPVDSPENNKAEQTVLKYLSSSFANEHQQFGLVDFSDIKGELELLKRAGRIKSVEENDLDDLMNWATMMIGNKIDVSHLYQELFFLENRFLPKRKALSVYVK